MFSINSLVVYPSYGVARISSEVVKRIDTKEIIFFELEFVSKDIKVLIPKISCLNGEIRDLVSRVVVEDTLREFFIPYDREWFQNTLLVSWNRRSKEYQCKIRQGMLHDIAMIYRDLKYIETFKQLSFGEKSILLRVERLFCEEIAFVCDEKFEDVVLSVRFFIRSIFYKNKYIDSFDVSELPLNFSNFLNTIRDESINQ